MVSNILGANTLELGGMDRIFIFDFDGVLADSLEPMLAYAGQVCLELGYTCSPSQLDLEALEKMEFAEFGRRLGIAEELIQSFVARNFQLFSKQKAALAIFHGMEEVIRELSRSAILTVVTGNSCQVVERFLDEHSLSGEFETVLAAEDRGGRVDKIRKIISMHGSSNDEIFLIGDAVSDIRAARAAGIKSIAVTWGHQSRDRLIAEDPDSLVDRPEDLLSLLPTQQID